MNILLFGDVVGKPGRQALQLSLPSLRKKYSADVVIANVENLAHGFGITKDSIQELRDAGVDYFTGGNHLWKNGKGVEYLATQPADIVAPANIADSSLPGLRYQVSMVGGTPLLVINVLGEVFMSDAVRSPFEVFDELYAEHGTDAVVVVDLHAEATGEKRTFGWYVDGRASAVVGTHTHVQTADEQILAQGTAYISDLGMTGAVDSSLGMNKELAVAKVAHRMDVSLEPPENPKEVVASGVAISVDLATKKATRIIRIDQRITV